MIRNLWSITKICCGCHEEPIAMRLQNGPKSVFYACPEYDKKYHGELLSTLQEILQCGWNLKESAEKLYIHYNSIKYRYSKICKVLNLDLSDHDNRSLVEIAMKLYRLKHYKKENQ